MSLGESSIQRALTWVIERLHEDPEAKYTTLIDQASREFDLTPLEADFLYRQLREALRRRTEGERPESG